MSSTCKDPEAGTHGVSPEWEDGESQAKGRKQIREPGSHVDQVMLCGDQGGAGSYFKFHGKQEERA